MSDTAAFETIGAIATAPGTGAIGIIRISGAGALQVLRRLVPSLTAPPRTHTLTLQRLVSPNGGPPLDESLVVFMRAPRSYTGEDVVELHCHGGQVNLRRVMDAVITAGARPAEPGEFTRRAFLNGRLDLTQAEAVADMIQARSEASLRLAQRHLQGRLSRAVSAIREGLARAVTAVEVAIDFSLEEHVHALDRGALADTLASVTQAIDELLQTYDRGRLQREGVRCVIAGRPNAGKSTLLNRILEEDRAIVSPQPGTTRDYLDADFVLDGQLYHLVDTAGLRSSADFVEAEGVRRTRQLMTGADLILYVVDRSAPWDAEDQAFVDALAQPAVLFLNKDDLPAAGEVPELPAGIVRSHAVSLISSDSGRQVLQALRDAAGQLGLADSGEATTISRARHREALQRARDHLDTAAEAVAVELDNELIALDLRLALDAVGEIIGVVAPDEILGRIFAEFCIGK